MSDEPMMSLNKAFRRVHELRERGTTLRVVIVVLMREGAGTDDIILAMRENNYTIDQVRRGFEAVSTPEDFAGIKERLDTAETLEAGILDKVKELQRDGLMLDRILAALHETATPLEPLVRVLRSQHYTPSQIMTAATWLGQTAHMRVNAALCNQPSSIDFTACTRTARTTEPSSMPGREIFQQPQAETVHASAEDIAARTEASLRTLTLEQLGCSVEGLLAQLEPVVAKEKETGGWVAQDSARYIEESIATIAQCIVNNGAMRPPRQVAAERMLKQHLGKAWELIYKGDAANPPLTAKELDLSIGALLAEGQRVGHHGGTAIH